LALEGEGALPIERICDHHLSWAQWFADSNVPGILRDKWFEPRHMLHQINRWDRDHTAELHTAWLTARECSFWRTSSANGSAGVSAISRSCGRCCPCSGGTRICLPAKIGRRWFRSEKADVYASQWRGADGVRLWTLVNRAEQPAEGALLRVSSDGQKFFDLTSGKAAETTVEGGETILSARIGPRAVAAIVRWD
jgi:hypothetical protein